MIAQRRIHVIISPVGICFKCNKANAVCWCWEETSFSHHHQLKIRNPTLRYLMRDMSAVSSSGCDSLTVQIHNFLWPHPSSPSQSMLWTCSQSLVWLLIPSLRDMRNTSVGDASSVSGSVRIFTSAGSAPFPSFLCRLLFLRTRKVLAVEEGGFFGLHFSVVHQWFQFRSKRSAIFFFVSSDWKHGSREIGFPLSFLPGLLPLSSKGRSSRLWNPIQSPSCCMCSAD